MMLFKNLLKFLYNDKGTEIEVQEFKISPKLAELIKEAELLEARFDELSVEWKAKCELAKLEIEEPPSRFKIIERGSRPERSDYEYYNYDFDRYYHNPKLVTIPPKPRQWIVVHITNELEALPGKPYCRSVKDFKSRYFSAFRSIEYIELQAEALIKGFNDVISFFENRTPRFKFQEKHISEGITFLYFEDAEKWLKDYLTPRPKEVYFDSNGNPASLQLTHEKEN